MKKNLLLVVIILFSLISCTKKNELPVFDSSDPMATIPGVEWALITSPYVACHKDADYEAEVTEHLRKGAIRLVKGTRSVKIDGVYESWYAIDEGWIPGNTVAVYSNKLKAEKALEKL